MAGSAPPAKSTLESIITRYRREVSQRGTPELEIRLQKPDYENFASIYNAMLAQNSTARITQMVSVIMGDREDHALRTSRIREITFNKGNRINEAFVRKEQLVMPFRVSNPVGISYIVALSAEYANEPSFISDEQAVIRAKARVSFDLKQIGSSELKPELQWRVDMTVTRQIMGSDAKSALKQIIAQMFATTPEMTPETFLSVLKLNDPAMQQLYQFEIEVEFTANPDIRDMVRPADVTAAANQVLQLANPTFAKDAAIADEIYYVAKYIIKAAGYLSRFANELGMKRLLPQALAITRADYRTIFPPIGYFLTEKADGKRALAIIRDDGRRLILTDTIINLGTGPSVGDTILDGELITIKGAPMFYAFDAIVVSGEDLSLDPFEKRFERLAEAVAICKKFDMPVTAKSYIRLSDKFDVEIAAMYAGKYRAPGQSYTTDGMIFVEPDKPYVDTKNYKWKPAEHNTIDMLVKRAPKSILGKPPFIDAPRHKLYLLFVGISSDLYTSLGLSRCPGYSDIFGTTHGVENYFPIQFSPSDVPLGYIYQHPDDSEFDVEDKIAEFRCGGDCEAAGSGTVLPSWVVTRVRDDRKRELTTGKYFGNDFYTAELIWLNYVDPFPIEQLWEGPTGDYFMQPKSGAYKAQTGAISFVKTKRIASLAHAGWVVDIGMGKGQDLGRYLDAEVDNIIAVDQDRAALSELVRRKYNFARQREDRGRKKRVSTLVHILAANANDPFSRTLDKLAVLGLPRMTADALVCNLAIHYFLADMAAMRNFISLVRGVLKIGGKVILTVLIGEAVHAQFIESHIKEGGTWDEFEGTPPVRKYSLKRLYSSNTLANAGQRIGVLLPFSSGQYYEEYLVNTTALVSEFTSRGFKLTDKTNILDSIPDFEARKRDLAETLTTGDKKWLSFYGELILVRQT